MTIEQLSDQLLAAGIPFRTVRLTGAVADVDYTPEATPQQRQQGAAIVAAADLRQRRSRDAGQILTDLQALPMARQLRVLLRLLAEQLVRDPAIARRAGEAIDGDEPE